MKDIKSYNDKNQRHGYWKVYRLNGNLFFKGHYKNGKYIGYWEYYDNGELFSKYFYI